MARKKPTIKEIEAKVEMLNRVNTTVVEMIENLGKYFKDYIEFKEDVSDFSEYLEERQKIRNEIIKGANNG
jgi:chromosome segregation ATPase